ncbi:CDP-diacylglycerol--serine O-phosphatidyltransferase [Clostridium ganghwense]|uniref:CDP-diacylglycerol--serine O-phosphatidyltransferase n=1 Tax=Clostridium ganghwense TaxID=312089 RepID=A0ABT4CNU4_9CLOT|nr:CDP-diacylglycerol--serine O-phosphatidyltransferase [Clostridium ganghwense]MCY6370735.1 CDP-diacylglycerol--serine O-phosphatidyltransferase [Clostridium ganghwense]
MVKIKNAIPNAFTLSNLACGIISLIMSFQGNYKLSCYFIILAALMDRYDGRVARYLNVSSELGKELDSLADLISFGVAPSILVFNLNSFQQLGIAGYILVLIFPIAGAYRLARFNITSFDGAFAGIPITAAGMLLALYCLLTVNRTMSSQITIFLIIILSYLMVSNLKFKKM